MSYYQQFEFTHEVEVSGEVTVNVECASCGADLNVDYTDTSADGSDISVSVNVPLCSCAENAARKDTSALRATVADAVRETSTAVQTLERVLDLLNRALAALDADPAAPSAAP